MPGHHHHDEDDDYGHDEDNHDDDDEDNEDDDEAYLVVNSLPQKKQRKNFIRPFELSVSLVVTIFSCTCNSIRICF